MTNRDIYLSTLTNEEVADMCLTFIETIGTGCKHICPLSCFGNRDCPYKDADEKNIANSYECSKAVARWFEKKYGEELE